MSGGGNLEHPFWRPGDGDGPALEQEIRSDGAPRDRSERRLLWRGFALLRRIGHDRLLFLCHAPLGAAPLFETRICPTPLSPPPGRSGDLSETLQSTAGRGFSPPGPAMRLAPALPPPRGGRAGDLSETLQSTAGHGFSPPGAAIRLAPAHPTPGAGWGFVRKPAKHHRPWLSVPGPVALPALRPGG